MKIPRNLLRLICKGPVCLAGLFSSIYECLRRFVNHNDAKFATLLLSYRRTKHDCSEVVVSKRES